MAALRCSGCGVDWPVDYAEFHPDCPVCGERTWWALGGKPMDRAEAIFLSRHAEFARWLEEHGRADSPEDLLAPAPTILT